MKNLWIVLFTLNIFLLEAQSGMYRHFPQTQAVYSNCEIKKPVKTVDGGYVFSFMPWSPNLHGAYPVDQYTIKTDSNFIPQWKKPYYASAISLPTGGIILVYGGTIEKVTASGAQMWIKYMTGGESTILNDGVYYSNKVRFVGRKSGHTGFPLYSPTSQAYSLLMDTMGVFVSHTLFSTSYSGDADFSKIERDPVGNFFIYSNQSDLLFSSSNMSLAKFDSSFTFVWGKTWASSSEPLLITDIDFLANGRIFATGMIRGNYPYNYPMMGALLKFDALGNLIQHKFFDGRYKISGLSQKSTGNYIVSSATRFKDSLFMFETDTAMNISWYNHCGVGTSIGTSIIKNNTLYTPAFFSSNPIVISNGLNGNSCASYSTGYSPLTSSIGISNFTLSPTTSSATINSGTTNVLTTQSYVDSCKCPVSIPVYQNNMCVGNTGTISIIGTGNLSWYNTATGNSFIQSGSQFVYSSSTPTTITVFAQDSACASNPHRTQINLAVHAIPSLSFSPLNPTICAGSNVFVSASGATNYNWSGFSNNSYVQNLSPSVTTIYTVTGTVAPACSDTKTVGVYVVPYPVLTISPPGMVSACIGSSVTLSAGGATTYTWIASGSNSSNITVSPTIPFNTTYVVAGRNSFCTSYAQTTVVALSNPTISITGLLNICAGTTSTLVASGANTYTWSNASTGSVMVVTPTNNMSYTVSGASSNGCINSQSIAVNTFPQPSVEATPSSYSVCEGESVSFSISTAGVSSFTWSNGTSSSSLVALPNLGTNVYVLSATNGTCSKSTSVTVYAFANPSLSFIASPTVFCEGITTTITAFGASTFTWNNFTNNNSLIVTPTANVSYSVTGSNGYCSTSDSINLLVHPLPSLTLSASAASICANAMVTLLVNGAQHYMWNTGSTVNILYQSPQASSIYTVTGTNTYGCSDTKTIGIIVHLLPLVYANSSQPMLCIGEQATLSATGANTYTWNSGDNSPSLTISPNQTTTYTVVGLSTYGCINEAYITQVVTPCTGINSSETANTIFSFFPNPFSDDLKISCETINEKMHAEIFNVLGQSVMIQKITEPVSILNLKDFANGVYYLKVTDGKSSLTQKVIKQ